MRFDPHRRRWAFSEGGGLRRCLQVLDTHGKPIGNYAVHDLGSVIDAWLVGLHAEISPILPRVLDWLDYAIANDEDFGEDRNFHRMTLHSARALGHWLKSDMPASEDWALAAHFEQAYWSNERWGYTPRKIAQELLDDYMAFSLQAGQYVQAIEVYERLVGVRQHALRKNLKPGEYAYALCLHQERGQFDEEVLQEAGRRMLQGHLEERWLGMGQSLRAAMWLKIVYWNADLRAGRNPSLTPLQVLLKAYDDMPQVARPDFAVG